MSLRRLSQLQWVGFLAGGTIWFLEYLAGIAESQAKCNVASSRWNLPHDAIQIGFGAFAGVIVLIALAASAVVFRETRHHEEYDAPPQGRLHFFSAAALGGNVIFLMIIILTTVATVVDRTCHVA
ncbi:MAG TPA: hypothetical protein VFL60_01450 [Gaiellaceae bacterium]|nr:hypothetical protein [Gaiellaceae bacterium]